MLHPLGAWKPIKELENFQNRLARIFEPKRNMKREASESIWAPSVDVAEDPEGFVIRADLPDVEKEDIEVESQGRVLTLRGERKFERESGSDRLHVVERSYGSFYRSFDLPDGVDEDAITANFENGVLEVVIPKMEEWQVSEIKRIRVD